MIFNLSTYIGTSLTISEMAGNIIPAIATTNAMTASICVLQAFKVMREELSKAKMVFLTPNGTERRLITEPLAPPNPECPICSVAQTTVEVDVKRATLNHLVEDLRSQLGYGEEFSINKDTNILYDPDEDINLSKTFSELGLEGDTFLTIIDESEQNKKVNLVLTIAAKELQEDQKPIHLLKKIEVPIAPSKKAAASETNGHAHPVTNGATMTLVTNGSLKRSADEAGLEDELIKKKGKVAAIPNDKDGPIEIEDSGDGAIVIDDD